MFNRNVRIILNFFSFINNKATVNLKPTIGLANYFSNYKLSDGSIVNVNIMDIVIFRWKTLQLNSLPLMIALR